MSTTIGPSYDPVSTAASLAENYVSARQSMVTAQTQQATATASALTALKSAISAYQSSLLSLTSNKSMLAQSATFSDSAIGSATADRTATPGSYSFFVERLATASQVSYNGLADSAGNGGTLGINLGGAAAFTVDLAAADGDADGTLTTRELAAAINGTAANSGQVSASVVTIDGVAQLILSAKETGAASAITLDTSAMNATSLKTALDNAANVKQMVTGQDALVWLGAQGSGSPIAQASNTFTNIDGVSMTFTKAQAVGDTPVTLTVAPDDSASIANVQKFIDNYNTLKRAVDSMLSPGDFSAGKAPGVFADDGGIRVLQSRLVSMLRQNVASGDSLAVYGIIAARDGTLSLDSARLTRQLALKPDGLDTLVGSSSASAPSGIAGNLDTYLKLWSSSVDGQIQQRQEANQRLQTTLASRQDQLDKQYNSAYQRYLMQFTQLQNLQSQMASNTSMFDALFGEKSN